MLHDELLNYVKHNGLEQNIHLLGFRKDIIELDKCADLFIFPSLQEGLPVALMEAKVAGVPVIASKIRGNTDLIEDGVNGFLFVSNQRESLKKAYENVLQSNNMKNIQTLSMEQMEYFSVDSIVDIVRKIYLH